MPNHCYNFVTIIAAEETAKRFIEAEMSFEKLCPIPKDTLEKDEYEARCNTWGTKWDRYEYTMEEKGPSGFTCSFTTAWCPPVEFFEHLLNTNENICIKCDWNEDAGTAGIWVGYKSNSKPIIKEIEYTNLSIEDENPMEAFDNEGESNSTEE